jgi:periplasmic protein TonB
MADVMEKKIATELIKLELLNNNNKQDEEALDYFKKNMDDFPWKDYGDYQNLIAVLAVSEKLENPSESLLSRVLTDAQKIKKAAIVKETHITAEQDSLKLNIYANAESKAVSGAVKPTNGSYQTAFKPQTHISDLKKIANQDAVLEEKKEVILNKQNISDTKQPPQLNKVSQPEINKTIKPLDHSTIFTDTKPEIKPSISYELRKQDIVNKQNNTEPKPFEVKKESPPVNGRILKPLDHKTVFADKKPDLKPLQTESITKDKIVNKNVFGDKTLPEIKPEISKTISPLENKFTVPEKKPDLKPAFQNDTAKELQSKNDDKVLKDNSRSIKEIKPGNGKANAADKAEIAKPVVNKTSDKVNNDSFTPVKSVSINIEEELKKIEQEVLKDIESIKVQYSGDVQNKTEQNLQNKKEKITLKDPDFENVRTILKEHSKITTKERKPLRESSSSMQSQFKRANWEESYKPDKVTLPVDVKEENKSEEVLVHNKNEFSEKTSESSESTGSFSSVQEKTYPHRREKRGLVLVIGILIIAIPSLLFFIFSGSNESDKNVNVASTQLPAVNINIEPQQDEEVVSESFTEETQTEETPKLEITQKTDVKTESKKETKPETKITIPPLPESPQIIESAKLNDLDGNETNEDKTTSQDAIRDIPITPIAQMKKPEEENSYFVAVEEMPEPIGGIAEIQKKVVYPAIASAAAVEGRVVINAYVDIYGNVTKTEVVKGIGYGCDESAVDAIKSTKFKPGKQRGKAVNVRITIPVLFKRM